MVAEKPMHGFRFQGGVAAVLAAVLCLMPAAPAFGLVLHPGAEMPASERPADGAIGRWVDNGSCVAVGPNYIITTRHQSYDPGYAVWIDGVEYRTAEIFNHYEADIRVVRITKPGGQDANLSYYVAPYTGTTEEFDTAVLGGYGKGRGSTLLTGGGVAYGYTWAGTANNTLRWGANRIDDAPAAPVNQGYKSYLLTADFDAPDAPGNAYGVAYEAIAADWDSGGGWFVDVSPSGTGDWRVVGLSRATEHGIERQAWFRNSTTGALDPDYMDAVRVGSYARWINGILNTTTWTGDAPGNWSDALRWSGAVPNTRDLWAVFGNAITADSIVTVGSTYKVAALRFEDDNAYTLSGAGSLTMEAAPNGELRIEVNRLRESTRHGAHTIGVPIALKGNLTLDQRSNGVFTLAGAISGAYSLTKTGEGVVVLAAANSFSGGLDIDEGTVRVTAAGGLGLGPVAFAAGTLDLRSDAPVTFANDVTVSGGVVFNVQTSGAGTAHTTTLKGLTVAGNRTLTLTGADGCDLAFSGPAAFNVVTDTVTLATDSADLRLAGGLAMAVGTISKTGPRTLTIAGLQQYGAGTALRVDGGTVRLDSDAGAPAARRLAVSLADGTAARFGSTQHLAGLDIGAGEAQLLPGAALLATGSLTLGAGGRLDLGTGDAILDYAGSSPLTEVAAWVASGCNGGAWDGAGIASIAAAADALTAIGVLDNTNPKVGGKTTFAGNSVDATSVLVKYTYWGDANLDGRVDANDYDVIDRNFLMNPPAGDMGWWTGDFNYDGRIDANDYDRIDRAFLFQGSPLSGGGSGAITPAAAPVDPLLGAASLDFVPALVPEPATLGLLGLGLAALAARRRTA